MEKDTTKHQETKHKLTKQDSSAASAYVRQVIQQSSGYSSVGRASDCRVF